MRVLIISANWGKGGPGGVASEIYYKLKKLGHECRFAYARESIPEEVDCYRIGTMADVCFHAISSRIFDNAGFMSRNATGKLIREIKRYNPDLLNIHNPLGYSMHVEKLFIFLKNYGIPVVWTLHDCWAMTGHCITGLCDNWIRGCGNCPRKKEYPASYFLDKSAFNLKKKIKCFSGIDNLHLITPSYWLAELVKTTYLKNNSINVIPNGIDLQTFKPIKSNLRQQYGLDNKIILLAVAGIWTKTKGAKYFYKLSEILDDSYAFVMIGKNTDAYLHTNDRIIHFDRTDNREQLAQWYTVADIFINPTLGDNFPTVNLEALACGTPVVTFDTGGSAESVGDCGEIVPQGDTEALRNAVMRCYKSNISEDTCLKRAQKYNKENRYQEYVNLFIKIFNQ